MYFTHNQASTRKSRIRTLHILRLTWAITWGSNRGPCRWLPRPCRRPSSLIRRTPPVSHVVRSLSYLHWLRNVAGWCLVTILLKRRRYDHACSSTWQLWMRFVTADARRQFLFGIISGSVSSRMWQCECIVKPSRSSPTHGRACIRNYISCQQTRNKLVSSNTRTFPPRMPDSMELLSLYQSLSSHFSFPLSFSLRHPV